MIYDTEGKARIARHFGSEPKPINKSLCKHLLGSRFTEFVVTATCHRYKTEDFLLNNGIIDRDGRIEKYDETEYLQQLSRKHWTHLGCLPETVNVFLNGEWAETYHGDTVQEIRQSYIENNKLVLKYGRYSKISRRPKPEEYAIIVHLDSCFCEDRTFLHETEDEILRIWQDSWTALCESNRSDI